MSSSRGSSEGFWLTGAGAANWCDKNNVDAGAKKVFLSLSLEDQTAIREQGIVGNKDNPSRVLMGRIRNLHSGYIPENPNPARFWAPRKRCAKGSVLMCVRGEAFRAGRRTEHRTDLDTSVLRSIIEALLRNLIRPLDMEDYAVLVLGDIWSDEQRKAEVQPLFREALPPNIPLELRVKEWSSGLNQVSSVISSLDHVFYGLELRKKSSEVLGAYIVRLDVELLNKDLVGWPKDKLCFLWKTTWASLTNPVNDILFYIPQPLFRPVRAALNEPPIHVVPNLENLHWLGSVPGLEEHVWFQYNFFHPSNTERRANPMYVMRSRPEGNAQPGKFVQCAIKNLGEIEAKARVDAMSQSERVRIWNERVWTCARHHGPDGTPLEVESFVNNWSAIWPNEAIDWYQPVKKRLQSLVSVPGVERVSNNSVKLVTAPDWVRPAAKK